MTIARYPPRRFVLIIEDEGRWLVASGSTQNPAVGRRRSRRLASMSAGWALLATGAVLVPLPGPGLVLMLAGLALLEREVPWARRLWRRIDSMVPRRLRRAADDSALAVRDVVE